MPRPAHLAPVAALFAIFGIALVLAQPSLTPPAGPIEQSGRFGTLIELNDDTAPGNATYRHVITEPGSYVLAGNIDAGAQSGILIDSDNVTIDLNGFTLSGTGQAGIDVPDAQFEFIEFRGITVRNGRIVGFETGFDGLDFSDVGKGEFTNFTSTLLADLDIRATTNGIIIDYGIVDRCYVVAEVTGIEAFQVSILNTSVRMVEGISISTATGISTSGCHVFGCSVSTDASLASATNGYTLASTIARGCQMTGIGTGFTLIANSIATDCRASTSTNLVSSGSQAFNSSF